MFGRPVVRVLVGLAGTQLGLVLASATRRRIGPVEVRARVEFAPHGTVEVAVPPLGGARIAAHRAPLKVTALATGVDADALRTRPAAAEATTDARAFVRALGTRAAAAGVGGAAALAAVSLHRPDDVAAAAAVSALAMGAVGATALATLDRDAWRNPQLDGLLTQAPRVLGDLRAAPGKIERYRTQLAELVDTAAAVAHRVADLPESPPADAIRLLHVSDIHLSPIAFALVRAVAEQYAVDAVLDTGDLVDWGTPAEGGFAAEIAKLRIPYAYVKGNHDSQPIVDAVAAQPNATVLSAEPVELAGLTLAGMPDPRFTPDKTTGDDRASGKITRAAAEFAKQLNGTRVDIALVHSPRAAEALAGKATVVLAGDTHRRELRTIGDGTTLLVQASTGGAGLRGVQTEPPVPFALSVLYVDSASKQLWGLDEITLGGLGHTDVRVQRRRVHV